MKVFVVVALLALAACAFAADTPTTDAIPNYITANAELFLGELQEMENGEIIKYGEYSDMAELPNFSVFGIPSCKLGQTVGNPICLAKCISRGHKGGYCKGKVCTCVG